MSVRLKALRPIAPGDEITVSYNDSCIAHRGMRRMALRNKLGFICRCYHCAYAFEEDTLTEIGDCAGSILYGHDQGVYGQSYHRHCRRLFAASQRVQLIGWHWKVSSLSKS